MCSGLGNENKTCNRFDQVKTELNNLKLKVVELGGKLCQNVNCNNGGTCHEGECICIDGFSGSTCDLRGKWYKTFKCYSFKVISYISLAQISQRQVTLGFLLSTTLQEVESI